MEAKKVKVLAIAPYSGLKELISSIAGEYSNFETQVVLGNLEEALQYLKKAEIDGASIILSRGGTTKQLAKHTAIPVLNIPVSGYDVLRSISMAQTFDGKRAVVGFESITHGYRAVNMLLDTDMEIVTIQQEEELPAVLDDLKSKDVRLIIGDVVTVDYAKRKHFVGVLITSGEESVRETFDQVGFLVSHIERYKEKTELYEQILDRASNLGVYVFSNKGKLLFQTPSSDDGVAAVLRSRMTESGFESGFPDLISTPQGSVFNVSLDTFEYKEMSVAVFTAEGIQERYRNIRISPLSAFNALSYNMFMSKNPESIKAIALAESLTHTTRPVLIQGESGVGKDWFGLLMHQNTPDLESGVVILDCPAIQPEDIEYLFHYLPSPNSNKKIPVLLNQFDMLTEKCQIKMCAYSSAFERFRFVATSKKSIKSMEEEGSLLKELNTAFGFSTVYLPPVWESAGDIDNLCSIAISSANERFGKQVIGLEAAALELCKQYRWPGNLKQICNVMEDAVKITEASFVSKATIELLLSKDKQYREGVIYVTANKTLDQLEKEIILTVLEEEGMNRSKAAERLGIGRSTMWRKLN